VKKAAEPEWGQGELFSRKGWSDEAPHRPLVVRLVKILPNFDTGACRNMNLLRPFAPEVWNNGNGAEAQDGRVTRVHLLNS
jgi:hypothetical protein